MRFFMLFVGVILVLASFTIGNAIGSWSGTPILAEPATVRTNNRGDLEQNPRAAAAPAAIVVEAKVLPVQANGAQASAYTSGVENVVVTVNVDDVGQAEARSAEDGNVEVAANVATAGDAQAKVRLPDNREAVANVVGAGRAAVRTGDAAQSSEAQVSESQPNQTQLDAAESDVVQGAALSSPMLSINEAVVNLRDGPGLTYPVISQATRSQRFTIAAHSPDRMWWRVCCIAGDTAWVHADLANTAGPLDRVAVATDVRPPSLPLAVLAPSLPSVVPTPPLPQAPVTAAVIPTWRFALEMATQHTEANTAVIYAWIHEDGRALDGYFLHVIKDGQAVGTAERSSALPLGTTKPAFPNNPEDKIYNLKMAFTGDSHPGLEPVGLWTVQLVDGGGQAMGPPTTFTLQAGDQTMEMYVRYQKQGAGVAASAVSATSGGCPVNTGRQYTAINMAGADTSHADYAHGDFNLALRGSAPVNVALNLIDLVGDTDPNTPKLQGLFADGRVPAFTSARQIYSWDWGCSADGCRGPLLGRFESTLIGMATTPGEEIRVPTGHQEIFGGGYVASVLYAEPTRVTLNYTRDGTAAAGYTVHVENLCVDPNLVALYLHSNRGGRVQLPALRNHDVLGTAAAGEIQVSIRDKGRYMDPRSRKDWWSR